MARSAGLLHFHPEKAKAEFHATGRETRNVDFGEPDMFYKRTEGTFDFRRDSDPKARDGKDSR